MYILYLARGLRTVYRSTDKDVVCSGKFLKTAWISLLTKHTFYTALALDVHVFT